MNSQMDNVSNKYSSSMYPKIALWLYKKGIFKTLDYAEKWFNKNDEGWTLAYIDGKKDNNKPYQNKVMWNFLWFKFAKPSPLVDAWHFFKYLMLMFIFISLSLLSISNYHIIQSNIWYDFFLNVIIFGMEWYLIFELTLNKK